MPEFLPLCEKQIEECIVADPEHYLEPGVVLIARQPVIDSGKPDLLGIDEHGSLVVYELKKVKASHGAINQAVRYLKDLQGKTTPYIRGLVERYFGCHGVAQISDFAAWHRKRYHVKDLANLFPGRAVVVSIGADSTAKKQIEHHTARGDAVSLIDLSGMGIRLRATDGTDESIKVLRKAILKTKGRPKVEQLRMNKEHYECRTLFDSIQGQVGRVLTKLNRITYPIGIWYKDNGTNYVGVDVFREGIGAVGILFFEDAVGLSSEIANRIDELRDDLVWVGGSYTKGVHTVLVIHSIEEWNQCRDRILRLVNDVNERIHFHRKDAR